jgi:trimethylamine:corrinoid methyltransferase-like protein
MLLVGLEGGPRALWEQQGSMDTYQLAHQKTREFRNQLKAPFLPVEVRTKVDEIINSFR